LSVHEIRVFPNGEDPRANALRQQAQHMLGHSIDSVTARVFYVEGISDEEAKTLTDELLTDPVIEWGKTTPRDDWEDNTRIEVAYQPGAMNPEADSIMQGAKSLGIQPAAVDSSSEYYLAPQDTEDAKRLLINETVHHVRTTRFSPR
jgi:phosphoribosylformylglycinamidine (FGAM) synthase PurS component